MHIRTFIIWVGGLIFLWGCSPRIYRPPALGAEYRFDEGLPPKKPRQRLFSPDMQRSLEKSGQAPVPGKTPKTLTATSRRDSSGNLIINAKSGTPTGGASGVVGAPATKPDTLTSLVPPTSPVSSDSLHNDPR